MKTSHLIRVVDNTRLMQQPIAERKAVRRKKAALQKSSRKTNRKRK